MVRVATRLKVVVAMRLKVVVAMRLKVVVAMRRRPLWVGLPASTSTCDRES